MAVTIDKDELSDRNITDYGRDIENLVREEGDRIRRVLLLIDESMAAIQQSRRILNNR